MIKAGDLIFWHGRNTIALIIAVDSDPYRRHACMWVWLLENGVLMSDDLSEGYTIIDENWNWPEWHINYLDPCRATDMPV